MNIPENYQTVMVYLIIKDAKGFLNFTKDLFNAVELFVLNRENGIIMHGEIKIGDTTIMFAESTDEWSPRNAGFFIYVEDADETYKKALELGCTSLREPSDQEYGRSAGIQDPYGNQWWPTSVLEQK